MGTRWRIPFPESPDGRQNESACQSGKGDCKSGPGFAATLGSPCIAEWYTCPVSLFPVHNLFPSKWLLTLGLWGLLSNAMTAQEGVKRSYIESNWGLAWISEPDVLFPGTSLLIGKQVFRGNNYAEVQGGLAFPSVLTAKMGIGQQGNSGNHFSAGVRIFPLHVYLQTGFPTKQCQRDVSKAKLRRLEKRGKTKDDIQCSEWVFSMELSPVGLAGKENTISLNSVALLTAAKRWYFN